MIYSSVKNVRVLSSKFKSRQANDEVCSVNCLKGLSNVSNYIVILLCSLKVLFSNKNNTKIL